MKHIKVTVKKQFLDRYTGIIRNPGDELTVSEQRFREILRSGDLIEITESTPKKKTN